MKGLVEFRGGGLNSQLPLAEERRDSGRNCGEPPRVPLPPMYIFRRDTFEATRFFFRVFFFNPVPGTDRHYVFESQSRVLYGLVDDR